ncbi:sugar phosphate nucleotidyltransferase [Alicyclobacillus acidiphilus]|uniref:sugar phosphate nucleotidyltransferase n=1 Tax=Alicyclobacillus acidiphilus TaxID=182455 RepID=UPI000833C024|nr:sugar phosphate nucleotidyltransferase [Alicyclobacillus acidiphilus]
MEAIIVTGGKGLRMAPFTKVLPKGLLPIDDRPILEIIVQQLKNYGYKTIHMACGYLASLIQAYFQDGKEFGVNIDYFVEPKPLGTAGPIKKVRLQSDQPVLVINCDILTTLNFREMMDFHKAGSSLLTIASQKKSVAIEFGVLQTNGPRVDQFVEKPTQSASVSMGIYIMDPAIVDFIPDDTYYDMSDLIVQLLTLGQEIRHFENESFWLDIGRPDDFAKAGEMFPRIKDQLLKEPEPR